MIVKSSLQAWGNSSGVRIPKQIMTKAGVSIGSSVTINARKGVIIIRANDIEPTLDELLAQMKDGDRLTEVDFGEPSGREIW